MEGLSNKCPKYNEWRLFTGGADYLEDLLMCDSPALPLLFPVPGTPASPSSHTGSLLSFRFQCRFSFSEMLSLTTPSISAWTHPHPLAVYLWNIIHFDFLMLCIVFNSLLSVFNSLNLCVSPQHLTQYLAYNGRSLHICWIESTSPWS